MLKFTKCLLWGMLLCQGQSKMRFHEGLGLSGGFIGLQVFDARFRWN